MVTLRRKPKVRSYQSGVEKTVRHFRNGKYVRPAITAQYNDPLYDEDYFRSMLIMERKRTERYRVIHPHLANDHY